MTKRMLIDASHAEETRVVVLDGNRLEEFDLEAATRKPLKGNIYLAKVVRVEPSLQAAFVEYGGNRHGFLAFSEIHPDYYQIPIADRQRLLEMQAAEAREAEEEDEDPQPESAMDRAAEEDLPGHDAEDEDEPGAEAATAAAAPPAEEDPAAEGALTAGAPAAEPPPAIASAAPDEAEAAAATPGDAPPAAEAPALVQEAPAAEAGLPAEGGPFPTAADTDPAPAGTGEQPVPGAAQQGGEAFSFDPALAQAFAEGAGSPDAGEPAAPPASAPQHRRHHRSRHNGSGGGHRGNGHAAPRGGADDGEDGAAEDLPPPETIGGEDAGGDEGEMRERRIPPRFLRHYKIQEVIKRRQIMLVQVVKEERGTKGAALTTYISLAGRFSVLMPNSPRGGGVSRKITSAADRKRLREAIDELGLPDGMSLIVRTAGAQRPKPEIKRDCEYLLRLWDNIRERTLASTAPALIYEEADLIKRAIRDVFSRDVEEIVVDGEDAYQDAREFMRMLMPQHVRKIQYAREGGLFARHSVEQQLDAMHSPTVQLRSGGYIVINQTEALVAIDVNSGRSTRERHIEDTALRTNLEAADEIARQLRLRDLAGLIVIDFIDMESSKHDGMVERRLKEALKHDRARIQVGRISHFGLLEMSRQRLRPSLAETTFVACPHCQGRGQVRSLESSALQVLRAIEEEGAKRRAAEICVHVSSAVALYLLNRKRERLAQIEERFGMAVLFEPDEHLAGPAHRIERLRAAEPGAARPGGAPAALRMDYAPEPETLDGEAEDADVAAEEPAAEEPAEAAAAAPSAPAAGGSAGEDGGEGGRRRRRRRRRRTGAPGGAERSAGAEEGEEDGAEEDEDEGAEGEAEPAAAAGEAAAPDAAGEEDPQDVAAREGAGEPGGRGRRRRRRGPRPEGSPPAPAPAEAAPRYMGPTPADPFAGHVDDILAAMEAAEAAAEAAARARPAPPSRPAPAAEPEPAPEEVPEALNVELPPDILTALPAPAAEAPAPDAAPPAEAAAPPAAAPVEPAAAEPAAAAAPPEPAPEPPAAAAPANGHAVPAEPEGPRQGPAIVPKVLGDTPPAEAPRRSGWWRR